MSKLPQRSLKMPRNLNERRVELIAENGGGPSVRLRKAKGKRK